MSAKLNQKCPHCDYITTSKIRLINHIENFHAGEKEILLECKNCKVRILYEDKYGECCSKECHQKEINKKTIKIISPDHKYSFVNIDNHKKTLFKEEKYNCPHCDSKFTQYNKFKIHMYKKHTKPTGICYRCEGDNKTEGPYCSRSCSNKREFSKDTKIKKARKEFEKIGLKEDETIIEYLENQLKEQFGNKYKINKNVEYENKETEIEIICKRHGKFKIYPRNIKTTKGCPDCYKEDKNLIVDAYIKSAKKVHNKKYGYEKIKKKEFRDKKEKISIVCPEHGKFEQANGEHLRGAGCPKCASKRITQEEVIAGFIKVHGEDKYDYSLVKFKTTKQKVKIICNDCGKIFEQKPNNHQQGQNCSHCTENGGYDPEKPGRLYYLKVQTKTQTLYKIGITNNTVKQRFKSDMAKIIVIRECLFQDGTIAPSIERKVLNKYSESRYKGPDILKYAGNTELFTKDIFNLDTNNKKSKNAPAQLNSEPLKMTIINDKIRKNS